MEQLVACQAHNLEVEGSSPSPAPTRNHNRVLALLRRLSKSEKLTLVTPDGKPHAAYYTNLQLTHARSAYTVDGRRVHVYGKILNGRIVPSAD